MTRPYDWNPMPHVLTVCCPDCGGTARFEFAEPVLIKTVADRAYFDASRNFEVFRYFHHGWKSLALYYHGLAPRPLSEIDDLPDGYAPTDWEHGKCNIRSAPGDLGTIVCDACVLRRKHTLDWPADAYYAVEYRGQVLWAFEEDSMAALTDFIGSTDRRKSGRRWQSFLHKIPAHFLGAEARAPLEKKLRAKLASGMEAAWP